MHIFDLLTIRAVLRDVRGATAIEYGLIAALIAIASITAMRSVGSRVTSTFSNISSNLR